MRRLMDRITAHPTQFAVEYRSSRAALPRRFPNVVYFVLTPPVIEVVAVLHVRGHRGVIFRDRE